MGAGVLDSLDNAKTQLYHFTAIVIAGMGFFTDAYDLFCISTVTKLIGRLYYYDPSTGKQGTLSADNNSAINGVALCGTLAGQLFFGWLGDKLGRKSVYGFTLIVMIMCAVGQGVSFGSTADSVLSTLCFFRFWLGFGVGGDYPLSATIMSEYANRKTRGAFIAAVFSMQGIGQLTGSAWAIAISSAFMDGFPSPTFKEDPIASVPPAADFVWRIVLMFGALPAALTFYWRMKMPETARYTALVEKNAAKAAADMGTVLHAEFSEEDGRVDEVEDYGLFSSEFARRHGTHLLGTTVCWFMLDVSYYSQSLFQKDIFTSVGWIPSASNMSAIGEVYRIARAQSILALMSTVPGYYVTVFTVDILGRWIIQLNGFAWMTVLMAILGGAYHDFRGVACPPPNQKTLTCNGNHTWFIALYALTFFFSNFGPNSTTFIVPAEVFPARLRSTCHGISAACGKAGAIAGTFGFVYLAESPNPALDDAGYAPGIGLRWTLIILAICSFIGLLFTFLVPETKGRSLEEISGELEFDSGKGTETEV